MDLGYVSPSVLTILRSGAGYADVWMLIMEEAVHVRRLGIYEKAPYLPLNFAINRKPL